MTPAGAVLLAQLWALPTTASGEHECAAIPADQRAWTGQITSWLEAQTDPRTGLIRSFEPTVDPSMTHQAATYDLAIAAILLAETCHVDRAVDIVDRLEGMWTGRGLPNYLTTLLAAAGNETLVHTGPNVWVALAALRVYHKGGEGRHLEFARAIADWVVDGRPGARVVGAAGVPWVEVAIGNQIASAPAMGPMAAIGAQGGVTPWDRVVSTEHALDTFALLSILLDAQAVPQKRKAVYRAALADLKNYLRVAASDSDCAPTTGMLGPDGWSPVCLRAGGEVVGGSMKWNGRLNAADVYYWWVAAIPDGAIAGAPDHAAILGAANLAFQATVEVEEQASTEPIVGTDYSNIANGGGEAVCPLLSTGRCAVGDPCDEGSPLTCVRRQDPLISVEWTGEAILANRLLAERAGQRSAAFGQRQRQLSASMDRLARTREGHIAYPYATAACACVFDGGWLTPAPAANGLAGSVAGTVWVAFGKLGINPFRIDPGHTPPTPPLVAIPRAQAPPACVDPALLADASPETLLAAAWGCWSALKRDGDGDGQARARVRQFASAILVKSPTGATIEQRAAAQQAARTARASRECDFDDWALNGAATALFLRALAAGDGTELALDDAQRIVTRYPDACFWTPRTVVGEPVDRFAPEPHSSWEMAGDPPRLAGYGFHVPLVAAVAAALPQSAAAMEDENLRARLAAVRPAVSWLAEGQLSAYHDHNLFFSEQHRGIQVLAAEVRAGGLVATGQWGAMRFSIPAYAYGRAIDAWGAAPLDQAVWLKNESAGLGIDLRLAPAERPLWLRELDIRLSLRGGFVGYHTASAADVKDRELLLALGGWGYLYAPVRRQHAVWAELGAAAYGGEMTSWSVGQRSLWLKSRVQAGVRLFHVLEPYGSIDGIANFLQRTDWDNNLRLGMGARVPLLRFAEGANRRFLVRVDGSWQRTVAVWPWVDYVPSFRPLNDFRISLDLWFGWS